MRTRSPRKNIQLRKEDQEKRRWKTMMAVKRRADCQAWNLYNQIKIVSHLADFNAICYIHRYG